MSILAGMKTNAKIFYFFLVGLMNVSAQTNFKLSDPFCMHLLRGAYPADTFPARPILADQQLPAHLVSQFNSDSLQKYLEGIVSYENRNTIADNPNRPDWGIRGARKWIRSYIDYWADQPGAVVFPCEFDFDYSMCARLRHTEIFCIIPGNGPQRDEMVILEAHLDSRCEDGCDTLCVAQGADDNGSGSTLLMDLTRVMSKVQLNRTLVIMWTTGEEQGLGGARAFATFCKLNGIKIKAVFNNDIVGGIECGITSSPPSCPGPDQYDSIRLKIFSAGTNNSMPKNLARMTRILVEQNLTPVYASTPKIDIMYGEDRSGRGGDHIPYREQGYASIRYTSAYEHGDGNPSQPGYVDRQHSVRDVIGKDIDGDGSIDSFYVSFNYLRNNAIVNALSASNAATAVMAPFTLQLTPKALALDVKIENPQNAVKFIYGLRRLTNAYFDTVFITDQPELSITGLTPTQYYITACGVDATGWISMFGTEYNIRILTSISDGEPVEPEPVELLQNEPNPFDDQTLIPIIVNDLTNIREASLHIHAEDGRIIKQFPLKLHEGNNEILYDYGWHNYECGVFFYSLVINGKKVATRKMVLSGW
jgi:hypothetical protein